VTVAKALGDHAEGFTYPNIVFHDIPLDDNEVAVFSYVIINNGHATESDILRALEAVASKLASVGANAAANAVEGGAAAAAGAATGALLGSPVPIIGTVVGAALGAIVGTLLGSVFPIIFANCDGPIGSASNTITGSELAQKFNSGQSFGHKDQNPGVDSPAGCGDNSVYATTWSVKPTSD